MEARFKSYLKVCSHRIRIPLAYFRSTKIPENSFFEFFFDKETHEIRLRRIKDEDFSGDEAELESKDSL
ncbi:hypothetical protein ES705_06758 [subsurface metagenome]